MGDRTSDSRDPEILALRHQILALRHQILVLQRQIDRPRFNETDRTLLALLNTALDRSRCTATFLIVKPETQIEGGGEMNWVE